jgi:hypothetical protein
MVLNISITDVRHTTSLKQHIFLLLSVTEVVYGNKGNNKQVPTVKHSRNEENKYKFLD